MSEQDNAEALYFISDLHLSQAMPHTLAAFEHFMTAVANDARAIYILGDLFACWLGDDMLDTPFVKRISARLQTLAERGIALYLMHGNRDFLLGARFAAAAGACILEDPHVIEAYGKRIVLTHGDALCTADRAYQYFRAVVRCRAVQRFFLNWPLRWRLALAARIRAHSQIKKKTCSGERGDVTLEAVSQLFAQSRAAMMIHGHTHRPARHRHGAATRWVLADWDFDHQPARGAYLRLDQHGINVWPLSLTAL